MREPTTNKQPRPDRTLGPGHEEFWSWCAKEELRLPRCNNCNEFAWPVVKKCEHCAETDFSWEAMSGKGKLASWCSFSQNYYKGMFTLPHDCILVELEEGPLFISNPVDFSFDEMSLDRAVELCFLDCEDSAGEFKLPVFKKC